jgi:hypothetical protein
LKQYQAKASYYGHPYKPANAQIILNHIIHFMPNKSTLVDSFLIDLHFLRTFFQTEITCILTYSNPRHLGVYQHTYNKIDIYTEMLSHKMHMPPIDSSTNVIVIHPVTHSHTKPTKTMSMGDLQCTNSLVPALPPKPSYSRTHPTPQVDSS